MSAPRDLVVLPDEVALAHALADRVVATGRAAIAARGTFDLALAGGSTPKAAYELLASPAFRDRLDWSRVRFFFGDERCVPPDDDQSNYKTAHETMLRSLGVDPAAVFRMHGEDVPDSAALAYAGVLRSELPVAENVPSLDLIMLGMGPDGHTASLFPGTDPLERDALLVKAVYVAKLGVHRITLTPRALGAAREIVVATAGRAKAEALAAVLDGPIDPVRLPSQILAAGTARVTWLVDEAAGALLVSSKKQ